MKNGTCPKCGKNELLTELTIHGGSGNPPFVQIVEPEPEKPPFMWVLKLIQSEFTVNVCSECGYTEFYSIKHEALHDGRKKGYQNR